MPLLILSIPRGFGFRTTCFLTWTYNFTWSEQGCCFLHETQTQSFEGLRKNRSIGINLTKLIEAVLVKIGSKICISKLCNIVSYFTYTYFVQFLSNNYVSHVQTYQYLTSTVRNSGSLIVLLVIKTNEKIKDPYDFYYYLKIFFFSSWYYLTRAYIGESVLQWVLEFNYAGYWSLDNTNLITSKLNAMQ